jgi:serine/threonine protein kinase
MEISPNTKFEHYTILSKIGAGGMGEVWRARDTRLGRDVAIKFLPANFAVDIDRLHRFEQEARATSALNHPNILTVFDVGNHDGAAFIVAELLEGEELRDRLNHGQIPLRKAIDYAQQIVNGLAAAHGKGIVHRDLKPENLFITNDERLKILDFGIAKLSAASASTNPDISEDATRKVLTNPGVVMGTVGYMSPEQVRGEKADHRSDIFSFGAILHEMLSGRRAFKRETMAETMTAILKEEPEELSASNPNINPALERIVQRCLEKKPERRFHSAHDLSFALESISTTSSSGSHVTTAVSSGSTISVSSWRPRLPWIAVAVLALALVGLTVLYLSMRSSANTGSAIRLTFTAPPELAFNDSQQDAAVISPDGQKIAFTATSADGKRMLYIRNLDSSEVKLLPGSENALEPFWSPDSRSIGYGSNGKLKRSDLRGTNAQVLCDAGRLIGGTWSKDRIIVFAPDYSMPLMQVPAQGGEPKQVEMQGDHLNADHRSPYFLPDGRHFLFPWKQSIWVGSLDSPEIKQISDIRSLAIYAHPGWLVFVQNDSLMAQAFDAGKLAVTGEPIPIITGAKNSVSNRRFSVSENGVLVWQGQWQRAYQLVWYDRSGKQTGKIDAPVEVSVGQSPMLSPDGKRVAVRRTLTAVGAAVGPVIGRDSNIWVVDLDKGTSQRITSTFSQMPVWSPDGSRILYNNGNNIVVKAANGLGEAEMVLARTVFPAAWSSDGRFVFFMQRGVKTRLDLWAQQMSGDKKDYVLSDSPFDERNPQLSPNGRWLAYTSDESGTYQIYVQGFSADGKLAADKRVISTTGGVAPIWRRDGNELFFIAADDQLMAASVKTDGTEFQFDTPKPLFKTRTMSLEGGIYHEYDVSPDGQRFLIGTLIGDPKAPPPTVIINWTALVSQNSAAQSK